MRRPIALIDWRSLELRASWEIIGCTMMSDGWTHQKGRTLLNILVNCPKGAMFIKFVDASTHIKDALLLCGLLDRFNREVGPQNVKQVITDNATNYVVARKLLMQRYPTLFWTPCAANCIVLILEDMGKIPYIKDIVESSRSITKFIYNHAYVLSMMRDWQITGSWCILQSHVLPLASYLFGLSSLVCGRWRERSFQMSGMLYHLAVNRRGRPYAS
jgi:hypothetical protein